METVPRRDDVAALSPQEQQDGVVSLQTDVEQEDEEIHLLL